MLAQPVAGSPSTLRQALRHIHDQMPVLSSSRGGRVVFALTQVSLPRRVGESLVPLPPTPQSPPHELRRELTLDPSLGGASRHRHIVHPQAIILAKKRAVEHRAAVFDQAPAAPLHEGLVGPLIGLGTVGSLPIGRRTLLMAEQLLTHGIGRYDAEPQLPRDGARHRRLAVPASPITT